MPAPSQRALIDLVDETNQPIGLVERGDVFADRVNFRTVHVLLTNDRDELLLQRLARSRERHRGLWGSSVAGYLFAGEGYLAGAVRRTKEEVGVDTSLRDWGVLPVADSGCTKFVGIFSGQANRPRNLAPEQIDRLEYRSVDKIERDLAANLSTYTSTFADVFAYWRAAQT